MGPKRKRATDTGAGRPSPHRPADTSLGQHDRGRQTSSSRAARRNERRDSGPAQSAPNSASPLPSPSNPRTSTTVAPHPVSPLTTSTTNAAPLAPSPPTPIQSGYIYDIVTDSRLGNWVQSGRQELIDHGVQSRNDEDVQELSTIFQELIQSCLDFRLQASQAGETVKIVLGPRPEDADTTPRGFDPHILFLDTVSVYLDAGADNDSPHIRDFMVATGIDPVLMRRVLEPALLQQLGLIRDTFTKMGIRQATNILYKQANYNLLREETEGYAKLATELFTTCNTQAPTSDAVQAAFERVKGLIGTFDLDVGRVLDVLLDVFASVLIKQNKFFVKFLRISSWWPRGSGKSASFIGGLPQWALPESKHWHTSEEDEKILNAQRLQRDVEFWHRAREIALDAYFELGDRKLQGPELQRIQAVLDANHGRTEDLSDLDADTQWMVITKTVPPQGNRVAAQLLGFKLRFYDSDFRDKDHDVIPANLFYMTALLIKIGFISLADLWPHLSPDDDGMEEHRREREAILKAEELKKTGKENALTMAAALTSDEPEMNGVADAAAAAAADKKKKEEEKEKEKEKAEKAKSIQPQKILLLTELLTMGAIPEALYILARYPWITEVYPDILKLLNRLLHHSIHKVFEATKTPSDGSAVHLEIPPKRLPDIDQTGAAKGSVKLGQVPPKRLLRWPHPDGESNNIIYRYYWDEWADNVPVCQSVDDVFTLCDTLLNLSWVNIGRDPALLAKLAEIGALSIGQDQSSENMSRWKELLARLLVPALSLTEANSFAVQTVWDLLKLFPITTRYAVYECWFPRNHKSNHIKSAFALTTADTEGVLKRLSLTNLSAMAKKLAKIAYSSPGIVYRTAFDHIEAYPNLIEAFVECARYFTDLGYDVLTWSLLTALGGKSRSRTQQASVLLTSKWLQALSKFSGRVFKRYPNIKPSPVLQYVNSQLFRGSSTDLVILRELIVSMAGVVSDIDFTDTQMRAMTGGDVLRRQTLIKLGDRRFDSAKGAKRLMQSLIDTKLAGKLLINLAQYRQATLYRDDAHVKYLATIMDEVQQALIQYLELLRANLPPDEFDSIIPGIVELMTTYGLDVNLAFMIGRASLLYRMTNSKAIVPSPVKDESLVAQQAAVVADTDGDVTMNDTAAEPVDDKLPLEQDAKADQMVLDEKPSGGNTGDGSNVPSQETRKPDPIADVLQPLVDTIQNLLPPDTWKNISPEFYVTFWSLSLGDLYVPQASYEIEHDKLYKESNDVMKDRTDMSRQGMNRKEEKKAALVALAKSIREEMSSHIERYQKTKFRLARQAKFWFSDSITDGGLIADALLEHCLLPRLHMSASDTEYSFRLMKFLHENQTPNFKLFALYEQFFNANRLRALIFSATVREAEYLGRFLKCILEDLAKWHSDKAVYEKEAFGPKRKHLGFATAFDEEGNPTAFIEHPFFRDAHYEWHKNLNIALKACLQGTKEWMHIRNALTILRYVHDFFPAVNFMGSQLLKVLDEIKTREAASKGGAGEEEHRVDLSVAAQTIFAMLKRRETKWISVQAFRPNMSGMPQDGPKDVEMTAPANNSNLRPTAPEFQPQQAATSVSPAVSSTVLQRIPAKVLTQDSEAPSTQPGEVEDGEVKDGKDPKKASGSGTATAAPVPTRPATSVPNGPASREKSTTLSSRPATPKPSTPGPTSSSGSSRNENSRSVTSQRPPGLPNRPDVPIPGHYRGSHPHFSEERRDLPSRDSRETVPPREVRDPREAIREARERHRDPRDVSRDDRESRDHRQPDNNRGERRDHHDSDRRSNDNMPRESGRLPDRDWPNRPDAAPRRGEPSGERDGRATRDRGQSSLRDSRGPREQPSSAAAPPPTAPKAAPEEPPMNPQRAALLQTDERPDMINPQRAAYLHNTSGPSSTRSPRDNVRDRASSRANSPRRDDRHNTGSSANNSRDDRHNRRPNAPELPQLPPRDSDLPRDSDRSANDRLRDAPHQGLPSRPHEPERGRSNQQDPNYGRLNPIPSVTDTAPQGPRGRGARASGRGPNTPTAPRSGSDGRMLPPDVPRPPSPDRQPPTGPSSSRPRRGPSSQLDQGQTPAKSSGQMNTGMHPDRAKQFEPQVSVHPDRMNHMGVPPPPPPPVGPPPPRSRPNMPPIHTNDRVITPTGPSASRHGQGSLPNTPIAENSPPYSAPTGPASVHERQRGSARRHLENLQASITPNRRDNEYRRQGQRASMPDSDAQILTGASPVSTPVHERPDPMRRNPMPDRLQSGNDINGPPSRDISRSGAPDDLSSSRGEHDRSGRRDHRERSDRSSRHGGRERSPRGDRELRDPRGGEPHDRHDRRSGAPPVMDANRDRDPNHEPIQPRRSMRDSAANNSNREPLGGGRDTQSSGRESRHRGDGRGEGSSRSENSRGDSGRTENGRGDGGNGARPGDEWGGGNGRGSMRGGPRGLRDESGRPGDDRREPRGDERTSSRKRRSDVADMPANDRDKRPRR